MSAEANLIEGSVDASRGPLHTRSACSSAPGGSSVGKSSTFPHAGVLIINADDWGRDHETTQRIFECSLSWQHLLCKCHGFHGGFGASRSASPRIGNRCRPPSELHDTFFSVERSGAANEMSVQNWPLICEDTALAQVIYDPRLTGCFEYLVAAQVDEFHRLYGAVPKRLDGHHHMHLCANVLWGRLLPEGTVVRRNFSFRPGEKSLGNRLYRGLVDRMLARRHRLVDFLFSLAPLEPADRLQGIFSLARQHAVELETHPVDPEEYEFLGDEVFRRIGDLPIASHYARSKMENESPSA